MYDVTISKVQKTISRFYKSLTVELEAISRHLGHEEKTVDETMAGDNAGRKQRGALGPHARCELLACGEIERYRGSW